MNIDKIIEDLTASGNMRSIPADRAGKNMLDFSTNDYIGVAEREYLRLEFLQSDDARNALLSSSASRLLCATQQHFDRLESLLGSLYGRSVLMFNSGYHANSGLIPALCDRNTLIIADRLVHASIIDGIMLAKCEWTRFRHNDLEHLTGILETRRPTGENTLVIVESVYSMDGDSAPLEELVELKKRFPKLMLYIDEAHAFGVNGDKGLGLASSCSQPDAWDVIIGTLGKAAASMGAFAVMSPKLKTLAVNRCRSFIFSTALPPFNAAWSTFIIDRMTRMDAERRHLQSLARQLSDGLTRITGAPHLVSHIQPFIVGDAHRAVTLSGQLESEGLKVLPIRTPTVPPGTERLRISLSASMTAEDIDRLINTLSKHSMT